MDIEINIIVLAVLILVAGYLSWDLYKANALVSDQANMMLELLDQRDGLEDLGPDWVLSGPCNVQLVRLPNPVTLMNYESLHLSASIVNGVKPSDRATRLLRKADVIFSRACTKKGPLRSLEVDLMAMLPSEPVEDGQFAMFSVAVFEGLAPGGETDV